VSEQLPDTWFSRDRPLLVEILRRIDSGAGYANPVELRTALGYGHGTYWAALQALIGDGYFPDEVSVNGPIGNVTGKARRELGT